MLNVPSHRTLDTLRYLSQRGRLYKAKLISYEDPDQDLRERIFKRMIPKRFPIEKDVDFHELSGEDMSGGEIKNVVLNAARIALQRNHGAGRVTMADFRKAMTLAAEGTWSQTPFHPIGFGGTS
jgi:ATP-dependent 26S proteasome regulatory subunit